MSLRDFLSGPTDRAVNSHEGGPGKVRPFVVAKDHGGTVGGVIVAAMGQRSGRQPERLAVLESEAPGFVSFDLSDTVEERSSYPTLTPPRQDGRRPPNESLPQRRAWPLTPGQDAAALIDPVTHIPPSLCCLTRARSGRTIGPVPALRAA
jgi:hypothetical protein